MTIKNKLRLAKGYARRKVKRPSVSLHSRREEALFRNEAKWSTSLSRLPEVEVSVETEDRRQARSKKENPEKEKNRRQKPVKRVLSSQRG